MNRYCPSEIVGNCGDDPVLNLSSEAIDGIDFPGLQWPNCIANPFDPICIPVPPPPPPCVNLDCPPPPPPPVPCIDGNCPPIDPNTPPSPIPGPTPSFYNQTQVASMACPSGFVNTYTVRAGSFISSTQVLADRVALTYAQQQVARLMVCPSDIDDFGCLGSDYSSDITIQARDIQFAAPFVITLVSGSLPPGLTFAQTDGVTATITGTPTTAGTYFFSVRFQGSDGRTAIRAYSLAIGQITPDTLPDASLNTPYSQTLTVAGMATPITWSVVDGALPDGLSLDSATGVISGTPTSSNTFTFTVEAVGSDQSSCDKDYTVKAAGLDFCALTWTVFSQSGDGIYTANQASASTSGTAFSDCSVSGVLNYKGGAVTCNVSGIALGHEAGDAIIEVYQNGVLILGLGNYYGIPLNGLDNVPTPFSFDFTISDTGGATQQIEVHVGYFSSNLPSIWSLGATFSPKPSC